MCVCVCVCVKYHWTHSATLSCFHSQSEEGNQRDDCDDPFSDDGASELGSEMESDDQLLLNTVILTLPLSIYIYIRVCVERENKRCVCMRVCMCLCEKNIYRVNPLDSLFHSTFFLIHSLTRASSATTRSLTTVPPNSVPRWNQSWARSAALPVLPRAPFPSQHLP